MGGSVADCGLESLEALQACNGLWEGVLLYNCEGQGKVRVASCELRVANCWIQNLKTYIAMFCWNQNLKTYITMFCCESIYKKN